MAFKMVNVHYLIKDCGYAIGAANKIILEWPHSLSTANTVVNNLWATSGHTKLSAYAYAQTGCTARVKVLLPD